MLFARILKQLKELNEIVILQLPADYKIKRFWIRVFNKHAPTYIFL